MPSLQPDRILQLLGPVGHCLQLVVVDSIDSTNQHVLMLADQGAPQGYCLVARNQLAGRGRQGRSWLSDGEGSLTFSLLWRFRGNATQLAGLPLVVSLAVAQGLERLHVDGLALKWPNDLLRYGRKIAGILVEISDALNGTVGAVIGIGLNVVLEEALSDQLPNPATDLRDAGGKAPERDTVLAAILETLIAHLQKFSEAGFAPFESEWMARCAHRERTIRLTLPNRRIEIGECAGLSKEGALLLRQNGVVTRFHAGDISLRLT
jgi:BirA family biotin operon repressor/biotin-[acetyl-CoA-carboxylase] ligase